MNTLFLLVLVFLAGLISKLYYVHINNLNLNVFSSKLTLLIPTSSLTFRNKAKKRKSFIDKLVISEGLGMISFLLFGLSILNSYKSNMNIDEIVIHFVYYFIIVLALLYLAIYDLINYAIPAEFITRLLLFSILTNLIIAVTKLAIYLISSKNSFTFFDIGNIDNLIGFVVLYFLTFLLVHFSKEKAMGKGDMDMNGLIGLSLGYPGFIVYLFVSLILGGLIASVYSLIIRKFRGVLIPLVPIILLSFVLVLGYTEEILRYLLFS